MSFHLFSYTRARLHLAVAYSSTASLQKCRKHSMMNERVGKSFVSCFMRHRHSERRRRSIILSLVLSLSLSHCGREFLLLLLLARPNAIFALPRRPTFRSLPGLRNPICNPFQTLSYIGFAGIYECRECARRRKIKFSPGRLLCTCNVLKSFTAAVERTSQSVALWSLPRF